MAGIKASNNKAEEVETKEVENKMPEVVPPEKPKDEGAKAPAKKKAPKKPKEVFYKMPVALVVGIRRFLGNCPHDQVNQLIGAINQVEQVEK